MEAREETLYGEISKETRATQAFDIDSISISNTLYIFSLGGMAEEWDGRTETIKIDKRIRTNNPPKTDQPTMSSTLMRSESVRSKLIWADYSVV